MEQVISADESRLVEALRDRDEQVFEHLIREYHAGLLRVAQIYVTSRSVAEEVVQETWLGVLNGIERFEARSSLKTWIFRILTNIAKTRAQREGRTLPFSALERPGTVPEPAVGRSASSHPTTSSGRATGLRGPSHGLRIAFSQPRLAASSKRRSRRSRRRSVP